MPVTLNKIPRSFTVLMRDGVVHAVLFTPATQEDRTALYLEMSWGECMDVFEVTAIDRYDAHICALNTHGRETVIDNYMHRHGVTYGEARAFYHQARAAAHALTPEVRAAAFNPLLQRCSPVWHFALIEAMRNNGDPTNT
ncbi:hypothetical protein ACIQU6_27975 [Streptomyces sp. NPDC090442]|uniref:hypothetical protein n=1 Tax=Streptomyces sp. NPDC090442 TaxID=3365962 RepID=UPI0038303C08